MTGRTDLLREARGTIERIAIVGDDRWRSRIVDVRGRGPAEGPVEFFSKESVADARAWLSA